MRISCILAALASTTLAPAQERQPTHRPLAPHSVKLFDVMRATHEWGVHIAPFYHRPTSGNVWHSGWEAGGAIFITTVQPPFFLTSFQATTLRALDSKSYSLSLLQSGALVGVRLGPVEPEAGIGLSTLNVDLVRKDFSVGMFSPRAAAGIGLRLGAVRLCAHAYSEYLWRWLSTDYFARGLAFSIRFRRAPPMHPLFNPSNPN